MIPLLRYIISFLISSLGIGFIINANLGLGPGDALAIGLSYHFPITVGMGLILIHLTLIILNYVMKKNSFNITYFMPILLRGFTVDLWLLLLFEHITMPSDFLVSWGFFLFGLFLLSFGLALYIKTPYTKLPTDQFMILASEKLSVQKQTVRIGLEGTFAALGFFLGAKIGIPTLIIVISLGPLIQLLAKSNICKKKD